MQHCERDPEVEVSIQDTHETWSNYNNIKNGVTEGKILIIFRVVYILCRYVSKYEQWWPSSIGPDLRVVGCEFERQAYYFV